MAALIAEAGGPEEFEYRIAQALGACVLAYKQNDPARSTSGSLIGTGRRMGRRDVATEVVSLLLGTDEASARVFMDTLEVPS
jgi:hypothetical protein